MSAKLTSGEIKERATAAHDLAKHCILCPRECGVDREAGARGFCGASNQMRIAGILPHFGEEPPLASGGAGAVFFSHCNLRCVYCQNHQISHDGGGTRMTAPELAEGMLNLKAQGCWNIEPVSPTHYLPWFLDSLSEAVEKGLDLPIVYNTNGYETPGTLEILDGIVDIYLPDLKYASNIAAKDYSGASNYVEITRKAIKIMYSQVGELLTDQNGRGVKGLIIRHLILPNDVSGTEETLFWVAANLPSSVALSLMAQYAPLHVAKKYPELMTPIAKTEYEAILDLAWELNLDNAFVQEIESRECGIPDFSKENPFVWEN